MLAVLSVIAALSRSKNGRTVSSKAANNAVAYHNGRVYTIDQARPWAEAFVVSPDGLFTAIGSSAEIRDIANKDGLVTYDLSNAFIMPGMHDAHVHSLMAGLSQLSNAHLPPDITTSSVVEGLKTAACACAYAQSYGDWLVADTYQIEQFDRECLDEAFANTPVMIRAGAGHSCLLITAALKRAGYDSEHEPDVKAAQFFRRKDGSLTGELSELAMNKAFIALPKPGLAHIKRALRNAMTRLHRAGVTSCQEASANTVMLHAFRELDAEGHMKVDISTHIVYAPEYIGEESSASLHALLDAAETYRSKHVDTRFVKIILDGVPLPPYFTHCGLDEKGNVDESKINVDDLLEAIAKYDARGMTCKIHCTGQGSTRRALDGIQAARKMNPSGPRHEIAHCSGVHTDDYPRFKELNVTAEMSPAIFFVHPATEASGGLMDWNFAKMIKAGAHITIGSDWGVPEDPNLLPAMAGIVEQGVGSGSKETGGERLCRMLTLAGAEAVGRQSETGSIEVGKKANFIALDRDLSRGEFEGASVLKTWFEGELVWDKTRA